MFQFRLVHKYNYKYHSLDILQIFLRVPREENGDKLVQIKSRHLLSRDTVPVELKRMVYNLFVCHFYSEDQFKKSNQHCNDEFKCYKLKVHHFLQLLPKTIFMFIFPLPVFFMFLNYFSEETDWNEREQLAKELNYTWSARPKTQFSAMASFSVTCLGVLYSFVLVDMLTCGLIWKHTKPVFKRTLQSTVNRNRNRAKEWIKNWLDWRKDDNSCRWWFVPYICLTSFWIIIAGMNLCPLALLFCHLIQARREQSEVRNYI